MGRSDKASAMGWWISYERRTPWQLTELHIRGVPQVRTEIHQRPMHGDGRYYCGAYMYLYIEVVEIEECCGCLHTMLIIAL